MQISEIFWKKQPIISGYPPYLFYGKIILLLSGNMLHAKAGTIRYCWFSRLPIEWFCWVAAFILLYFSNPDTHHFTLCPLENMGIQWCPGCGLGRSIALLLHGRIQASFHLHMLGIPAFLVLVYRIYCLTKPMITVIYKNNHE